MEKVLIQCNDKEQVNKVFDYLRDKEQPINTNAFSFMSPVWNYIGWHIGSGYWTIARLNSDSFENSKIISADDFLSVKRSVKVKVSELKYPDVIHIIAEKQDESLKGKSIEELTAMLK